MMLPMWNSTANMPNPERFGPHVRQRRCGRNLTLRAFAHATGIDCVRLAQLERHATTKPPLAYEVRAIALALDLDTVGLQRLADDFAPDMDAVESDKHPLRDAIFACRTEQ